MKSKWFGVGIALVLAIGCSGEGGAADLTKPKSVVEAYYKAVQDKDKEAFLGLMTEEWKKRAQEWKKSFYTAFFVAGLSIKSYEVKDVKEDGDKATVRVKAVLLTPEGEEDGEGMSFKIVKKDGKWWIEKVH